MGRAARLRGRDCWSFARSEARRTRSQASTLPLETVKPAQFDLPDPTRNGDYRSCRLLARCAAPGLPLQRRPVPLFAPDRCRAAPVPTGSAPHGVAAGPGSAAYRGRCRHRQDDRGGTDRTGAARPREVPRLAVLCPPHLAEQWQAELTRQIPHRRGARARLDSRPGWSATAASASRCSRCTPSWSSRPTSSRPSGGRTNSCAPARSWSSSTRPTPAPGAVTARPDGTSGIGSSQARGGREAASDPRNGDAAQRE